MPSARNEKGSEAMAIRSTEQPFSLEELGATATNGHRAVASNGNGNGDGAVHPSTRQRVSVIIPAKDEESNIAGVLARLPREVDEIILVDGRSNDRTVEMARAARPDLRVVAEPWPGKGSALRAGFANATGDVIVMIDADGSMEPAEISRHLALLDSGFDLVKGSRFMAGGDSTDITGIRRLGNRMLLGLVN